MADEVREEEEWLYGDGGEEADKGGGGAVGVAAEEALLQEDAEMLEETPTTAAAAENDLEGSAETNGQPTANKDDESEEDDDDDSDDDDDDGVQVVIGDIKSSAQQSPFGGTGIKRPAPAPDKKGKFSVEDFETPGTINGDSALEYNIDGIEDKPWRKPGADITDYFNYGFTEETWRAYTDRQKRMRFESGGPQIVNPIAPRPDTRIIQVAFGGQMQNQQRMDMMMQRRREEPKENTIQVMTADRREYSRKNFEMGMGGPPIAPPFNPAIPPPNFPPPGHGGPDFMPNPEYFNHPPPQYYPEDQGYEEQNEQWMDHHTETWDMGGPPPSGSSAIVSLTKVPNVPPPPGDEDTKHERKD